MLKTLMSVLAAGVLAPMAHADIVIFQDDFESPGIKNEWGPTAIESASAYTRFMGRYSYGGVSLYLPMPEDDTVGPGDGGQPGGGDGGDGGDTGGPNNRRLYVEFDLFVIDSWDSTGRFGPDTMNVAADNVNIFTETFSNHNEPQSYARVPDEGGVNLGLGGTWADSIYRNIRLEFDVSPDTDILRIVWSDLGLQGMDDESWGIDNVEVGVTPSPASLAIGALGLAGFARRRR